MIIKNKRIVNSNTDYHEDTKKHDDRDLFDLQHNTIHKVCHSEGEDNLERDDESQESRAKVNRAKDAHGEKAAHHDENIVDRRFVYLLVKEEVAPIIDHQVWGLRFTLSLLTHLKGILDVDCLVVRF